MNLYPLLCGVVFYQATIPKALSNSTNLSSALSTTLTPNATSSIQSLPSPSYSPQQSLYPNITITPTSTNNQPSPSPTASRDSVQIDVGDSEKKANSGKDSFFPPDSERRDFELTANTKMKWVPYLLDKAGDEFIFMKKYIQNTFDDIFKGVPGFLNTELSEFLEEKVTFKLIIYTRKIPKVSQSNLESLVNAYKSSPSRNTLKIYAYEITPRFQEMAPDGRIKNDPSPPAPRPAEPVNGFVAFMTGFGVMLGMILVCTLICITKQQVCQKVKSKLSTEKEAWHAHENEAVEQ